jgi:hypothetical protein
MKLPETPAEVVDFIGGNYASMLQTGGEPTADTKYVLSIHDLLSAFAEFESESEAPEYQLPLATDDEKIAGWTLSYKFLEILSDTIDYRPSLETVESILLNAKQVCIAMQNPAVQPVAGQQHTPEIGQ